MHHTQRLLAPQPSPSAVPHGSDAPARPLPSESQSGLQYTALASVTSTDSVLRDLPSLSVAFPEFKLAQPPDSAQGVMLFQQSLTQYGVEFRHEYLETIVANANIANIRFPLASQITVSRNTFVSHASQPLSGLAESILNHCSRPAGKMIDTGHVYQLPQIDPYDILAHFRSEEDISNQSLSTSRFLANSSRSAVQRSGLGLTPPMSISQKRGAQDSTDDEMELKARAVKKVKSRSSSFMGSLSSSPDHASEAVSKCSVEGSVPSSKESYGDASPATPTMTLTTLPLIQQQDSSLELEDLIAEFLDRMSNSDDASKNDIAHLTRSELKRIARSLESLPKDSLFGKLQLDIMSGLLRYLDTAMDQFATVDDILVNVDEQTDRLRGAEHVVDHIVLLLDHITLSLLIFERKALEHQRFPEELLLNSLIVFKSALVKFLVPALEFAQVGRESSDGMAIFKTIASSQGLKARMQVVAATFGEVSALLQRSCSAQFSDEIIVKLVYMALSLFFIDNSSDLILGQTESESLKHAGSSLLLRVYATYATHRIWILEEILSLLVRLPHGKRISRGYRLVDGTKIQSSSVLLMQLVQTCAEGPLPVVVPLDFSECHGSAQKLEMQKLLDGMKTVLEAAKSSVAFIFNFLLSRCTKSSKSSVETDYRIVLDNLLADLLTVLGQPEWPSAELCLYLFSKAMIRHLDDSKVDSASKAMAIDAVGSIAARIKTILNQLAADECKISGEHPRSDPRLYYGGLGADTKLKDLQCLQASYRSVMEYLTYHEINDAAAKAARNTWISQWVSLICTAATRGSEGETWKSDCWGVLVEETSRLWKLYNDQDRETRPKFPVARQVAYHSAVFLTARLQLTLSFDALLSRILLALEGGAVTLRARSLKALSLIVMGDCSVLAQQNVRKTIALRLQDQSPSVRDAATDLVGKYMLQDAAIRKAYYDIVSDRISDTGLNVRKRVLRLLRDVYHKTDSTVMRSDISQKLLLRAGDDESTVKDLAIRSVSDVWFGSILEATKLSEDERRLDPDAPATMTPITPSQKREVSKQARTLVDMVGKLSPLQDEALGTVVQHLFIKERGQKPLDTTVPGQEFARSCAVLVDCLVDLIQTLQDEEAPKSAVASTVQTLHLLARSEPRLINAKYIAALLPYLHCSVTSEDWRVTMFVLRIYQEVIPVVHDVPSSDSHMAEKLVLALVAKCPVVLLPEAVSVLCLMVDIWPLHSGRLSKFFQACMDILNGDIEKLRTGERLQENKTRRLLTIAGLMCKHFPFEQAIKESQTEAHLSELKVKMSPTVQEFVFGVIVRLYEGTRLRSLQQTALQSLGHVYMSFPMLMSSPKSCDIMDSIFAGQDNDLKTELLRIYSQFLAQIQTTSAAEQVKGATYSLVAKAEDHIEAGIGGAVMQRYLDRILQCALVNDRRLQAAAVDVISQVTIQALVHPLLCMPAIVALETSEETLLSGRVLKIHRELHRKHASLIYARSIECVRTMYTYQRTVREAPSEVQGFKVISETGGLVALLAPMYALVAEKRQTRNALLSALVKIFDADLTGSDVELDGNYARFIAENLAYLDYRTTEEIYLVLFYLNRIIAGVGMTLLHNITEMTISHSSGISRHAPINAGARRFVDDHSMTKTKMGEKQHKRKSIALERGADRNIIDGMESGEDAPSSPGDEELTIPIHVMTKASIAVGAGMTLKAHLKRVYDISETKCQQFQPSAHASHKERPVARFTGALARIHWDWKAQEVDAVCRQSAVARGDAAGRDLSMRQLERFRALIEVETVELSQGSHRTSVQLADQPQNDTDDEGSDVED